MEETVGKSEMKLAAMKAISRLVDEAMKKRDFDRAMALLEAHKAVFEIAL